MRAPLRILHAGPGFVVVDKPAGLLSVAGPGEGADVERVLAEQGLRAAPVHRLDRDVSGCLLCAQDPETRATLEQAFRERAVRKTYWALALGEVRPAQGAWKFPLLEERGLARVSARGKPSTTLYRTLAEHPLATELEIDLVTGRFNQIRVHAAHAGHPLAGERKYARGKEDPFRPPRIALHAWRLAFPHPSSRASVEVVAELPAELEELRARAAELQRARKRLRKPGS